MRTLAKPPARAIETYTGRLVEPLNMKPEDVDILDIAHSLSNLCRYNGHCSHFYSVAEHSVHAADQAALRGLPIAVQRWALLHDAGEAYLSDLAAPLKGHFPSFSDVEDSVLMAVARKYELPFEIPPEVKEIDRDLLVTEADLLLSSGGENLGEDYTNGAHKLSRRIPCWSPEKARTAFLVYFDHLGL